MISNNEVTALIALLTILKQILNNDEFKIEDQQKYCVKNIRRFCQLTTSPRNLRQLYLALFSNIIGGEYSKLMERGGKFYSFLNNPKAYDFDSRKIVDCSNTALEILGIIRERLKVVLAEGKYQITDPNMLIENEEDTVFLTQSDKTTSDHGMN